MTAVEYRALISNKPNKYRNKVLKVHGQSFDSKKEYSRYLVLQQLEQEGKITDLRCQVRFNLQVNGERVCAYIADFEYYQNGEQIIEDVKSEITRKNPVYRIKKKLLKALTNIEIKEV